ncbi:cysteine-rich receptor-like protein kinase 2 [Tanacetum coccineum]
MTEKAFLKQPKVFLCSKKSAKEKRPGKGGKSCSGPESILVYEYLPNMSFDHFIFDVSKGKVLNWEKRYKILIGTAEGLIYLHENTKIQIIHRYIKVANILLDHRLHAKIADFRLARYFQDDKSHISTAITGTLMENNKNGNDVQSSDDDEVTFRKGSLIVQCGGRTALDIIQVSRLSYLGPPTTRQVSSKCGCILEWFESSEAKKVEVEEVMTLKPKVRL